MKKIIEKLIFACLLASGVFLGCPSSNSGKAPQDQPSQPAPVEPAKTLTPAGDAKVPGTSFHASGQIPCAMASNQPTGSCPFGVTREGKGSGIVTVTKPDGRTRAIFFEDGKATGYDMSQADPGKFSAKKQGDLNIIVIGQERYEIPDAVIFGG